MNVRTLAIAATCLALARPAAAQPEAAPSSSAPPAATVAAAPAGPEAQAPPPEWLPEVYGRYVTVPDAIVATLFAVRTSMHSYSVGAGVRWRWRDDGEWRFSIDYLRLGFAPGHWLEGNLPPASASWLDWDLGFLSLAASYLWRFELVARRLDFVVGAGAAVGVFIGDVDATDVVPTCSEPVADCVPWRRVTRRTLTLPTRVLGLPIATLGLDWRVAGELSLRLEGGLYGVPYVGGALALGL